MPDRTQVSEISRERFMELAREQMAAFEKREGTFRKKDRDERAARLNIPLNLKTCTERRTATKPDSAGPRWPERSLIRIA
jgi:hypothetical protein